MKLFITFVLLITTMNAIDLEPYKTKIEQLSDEERFVLINKGTEAPYTGKYTDEKSNGIYRCKICNSPLYKSSDKFNSNCGWPSFDDEIEGAVKKVPDADGRRVEIVCAKCGGHLGHVFEDIVKQYFIDQNITGKLPFAFERIGRQWGKIHGRQKGTNAYEIDVVALNESSKYILFVECKWQVLEGNDAIRILNELKEKSTFVHWNNEDRMEYFAVVARKIKNKAELREDGIMAFDLDDISM